MEQRNVSRWVGLLGGTFDPPHAGHMAIAQSCLETYTEIQEVWWLLSVQNPLKSSGMGFEDRFRTLQRFLEKYPLMVPCGIEKRYVRETTNTIEVLSGMDEDFPSLLFVWLMGLDLLVDIETWDGWKEIFTTRPVVLFYRPHYKAMLEWARRHPFLREKEVPPEQLRIGSWAYVDMPGVDISSTQLRAERDRHV